VSWAPAGAARLGHVGGFSVVPPDGSELRRTDTAIELLLPGARRPPLAEEASGARPLAQLRAELSCPAGCAVWVGRCLLGQSERLVAPHLLDSRRVRLGELTGLHTVTHHLPDGRLSVTLEQWWVVARGRASVLSVSMPTLDLAAHAPRLDALAASLRFDGPAPP